MLYNIERPLYEKKNEQFPSAEWLTSRPLAATTDRMPAQSPAHKRSAAPFTNWEGEGTSGQSYATIGRRAALPRRLGTRAASVRIQPTTKSRP